VAAFISCDVTPLGSNINATNSLAWNDKNAMHVMKAQQTTASGAVESTE
jgi:hypothetical protein